MAELRPLHLHTVETVCADLIGGRAIAVGQNNEEYLLAKEESRSVLSWYLKNRQKWSGNVSSADMEAIVDAAKTKPPSTTEGVWNAQKKRRTLSLIKIEAHRFGGLHAYGDSTNVPENFVFRPTKPITLVEGWNGSGKTSMINAVIWCLTGQLLRPQRKPEETEEEFYCRIQLSGMNSPSDHKLTPVTPLPDSRFYPDSSEQKVPLDTWVELTFVDEEGNVLAPIRRSQCRTSRGGINEVAADIQSLGIDPIGAQIGTTIPGVLPFIQFGAVSEFGQAIAQLTGLSELVDLAKHAGKVRQRLDKDFTKARTEEIARENESFLQACSDLQEVINGQPNLKPPFDLPKLEDGDQLESKLSAIDAHFSQCKTQALENAKLVLGDDFDPSDKKSRDSLEENVGPALQHLGDFKKLASVERLAGLGKLEEQEIADVEALLSEIISEANAISELLKVPSLARRRQLYALVAAWMKEQGDNELATCRVCGSDLDGLIDSETGIAVRDEVSNALANNSEAIGLSITAWASSRLGKLSTSIPNALIAEINRDLPKMPADLLLSAIVDELFEATPFRGSLAVLRPSVRALAENHIGSLPPFVDAKAIELPKEVFSKAKVLGDAVNRIRRAISFIHWQKENKGAVNDAVLATIRRKSDDGEVITENSPLGVKLLALSETVKGVAPINSAIQSCGKMGKALAARRAKEKRISEYVAASLALCDVVDIGALAQTQVEGLRNKLDGRAAFWRGKIYKNAYSSSGYGLVGSEMDSKGALTLFVGANGVSAPAQHVLNASALRAGLVGFYFAFWEYVYNERGGLKLLILDDPQELLDDHNRDRLARTLPHLADLGGQLIVTTHGNSFARMSVAECRKKNLIEHRSVHPVNAMRLTANTAPAIEEVDHKRIAFEVNLDDAEKAQSYIADFRVFVEERLADLFDDPAYPAYAISSKSPTLSDYLGRLRGLVDKPPNELFLRKPLVDFCKEPALREGAGCLALLNKAHHKDKSKISYKEVFDETESLKRLRRMIEDMHEEFRRWKWRDPAPATVNPKILEPANCPQFSVQIFPDLAAFTGAPNTSESQDVADGVFDSSWFDGKSLFYLRTENMGFAAPATSIVIVDGESSLAKDRDLVIAFHRGDVLARRLFRPSGDVITLALAAQTPDPRKSPPTRIVMPEEAQLHRVRGVLFNDLPPPLGKGEAFQIGEAPSLQKISAAYKVRNESALPLALPGQIILGGALIFPADLEGYEGKLVALTLTDGTSIFKRVGSRLAGFNALRQFESIGGLGASEVIVTEVSDASANPLRVMAFARQVLGVIYL